MAGIVAVVAMLVATSHTPTTLPAAPMENARVIVAPCSPLMVAQQQWSWPSTTGSDFPLTLEASGMVLHLLPPPAHSTATGPAGVVRSTTAGAATWLYNETLSVLQLVPAAAAAGNAKCLMSNLHGMASNVASGDVPAESAFDSTADFSLSGGSCALFRNRTDRTIRFIWRDSYDLNHRNFSVCLTATWVGSDPTASPPLLACCLLD